MKTNRGFQVVEFTDLYGIECSIQQSSLADQSAIWLGPNNANPQLLVRGEGWQPYDIPENVLLTTRAHLSKKMVKSLIKQLEYWVKTGDFYEE